jgi:hypothetical protein
MVCQKRAPSLMVCQAGQRIGARRSMSWKRDELEEA